MKKNSIKHVRINAEVHRELSNIIRNQVKDPHVGFMTSVSDCEIATDLKTCKVYISILGNEREKEETMAALERAKGFIRHQMAVNLNLRNTPELTFIRDDSQEYGNKMSKLIDEVCGKEGSGDDK